jgi:hypothetical protein
MRLGQTLFAAALLALVALPGQGCGGDEGYCCVCKYTGDGTTCGVNIVSKSDDGDCQRWCSMTIKASVPDPGASTEGRCSTSSPPPCSLQ